MFHRDTDVNRCMTCKRHVTSSSAMTCSSTGLGSKSGPVKLGSSSGRDTGLSFFFQIPKTFSTSTEQTAAFLEYENGTPPGF